MIAARWFDGRAGNPNDVGLLVDGDDLLLTSTAGLRRYSLGAVRGGDRFAGLPLALELPDGGSLWVDGSDDDLRALLPDRRGSIVGWLTARTWAIVLCLVLLLTLIAWLDRHAVGWVAARALRVVPASVDKGLGEKVLLGADAAWLERSKLPSKRRTALLERFEKAATIGAPDVQVNLVFRRMRNEDDGGLNAFALPGGTIVLLDGLAEELEDDELLLVLGHEIGHAAHRDGMHAVARSLGLMALASTVWGDFSTWAATFGATVETQAHSRQAERAADDFMREFARRNSLRPEVEVGLWETMRELQDFRGGDLPSWLSTHPATEERLAAARAAASGTPPPTR